MIRPQLLVSVRDLQEAHAAFDGGADVIDIKDPSRGSLGMADNCVIAAICDAIADRRPVTAALGELDDWPDGPALDDRLTYVKIALAHAPADWPVRLAAVRRQLDPLPLIAAAYADAERCGAPAVDQVLSWVIQQRAAGLLIDTCIKDGRGLMHWLTTEQLRALVGRARQGGVIIALAGSLQGESLHVAADLQPDLVAVRGAACAGHDRNQAVDAQRVAALKQTLAARTVSAGPAAGSPVQPGKFPER